MGVLEVPEMLWGRWEDAQEKNVRCKDPRGFFPLGSVQGYSWTGRGEGLCGAVQLQCRGFAAANRRCPRKWQVETVWDKSSCMGQGCGLAPSSSFTRAWHPTMRSFVLCCLGAVLAEEELVGLGLG